MVKSIIGLLMMIASIFVGLYVAFYLCLFGGIVQILENITGTFSATEFAIGVVRVLCTNIAGYLSVAVLFIPGFALLSTE